MEGHAGITESRPNPRYHRLKGGQRAEGLSELSPHFALGSAIGESRAQQREPTREAGVSVRAAMPSRRRRPAAKPEEDEDAVLEAAIRENEGVPGSPAAQRLEREQRAQRLQEGREQTAEGEAETEAGNCWALRRRQPAHDVLGVQR